MRDQTNSSTSADRLSHCPMNFWELKGRLARQNFSSYTEIFFHDVDVVIIYDFQVQVDGEGGRVLEDPAQRSFQFSFFPISNPIFSKDLSDCNFFLDDC